MDAYLSAIKRFAIFDGRTSREDYWEFFLQNFIVSMVVSILALMIERNYALESMHFANSVDNIYSLALLIPSISIGARRLHDAGYSGWWVLFPVVNLIMFCFKAQESDNQYGRYILTRIE